MKFKYDAEILQYMRLFENVTKARVKDCFINRERLHFVIEPGNLRKALGKDKVNVKKLEDLTKKKVKIIEYSDNVLQFIINVFAPLKVVDMKNEDGIVTITGPDTKTKGLMIGAQAQNLRNYEKIVQKFFSEIKEIKVV